MKSFLKKHWVHVSLNYGLDAVVFCAAFFIGAHERLGEAASNRFGSYILTALFGSPQAAAAAATHPGSYWPGILLGALFFPSCLYIFGLYSPQSSKSGVFKRALVLGGCLLLTTAIMFGLFYVKTSANIGRGVMLRALPLAYLVSLLHHALLVRFLRQYRERVAFVVTCAFDELETKFFESFGRQNLDLIGVVHSDDYQPAGEMRVLGRAENLRAIVRREELERVLCTTRSMNYPALGKTFCELRYSGITVMPMISLFEEVHQMAPLELVTPEWLVQASAQPHILYVSKIKRAFDIITSLGGLVAFLPVLLAGILLVRLTGRGPVFYRQTRCGRFGRRFQVIKLRTMRVDAEKHGAVWAKAKDSRITWVGRYLRKFRVDEIPQLINVLRGEMSFVGPRPERPEFIEQLAREIPFFQERLMVQPGITGWAQVNYPYGASSEDARRKLEYDLYYTKNMSLFLDIFILLDTVRIVLQGGLREKHKREFVDTSFLREPAAEAKA